MVTGTLQGVFGHIRSRRRTYRRLKGDYAMGDYHEIYVVGSDAFEYFCCRCRQLRLSPLGDSVICGNCGNRDIITGPVGSLDKAALIRKLDGRKG